MKITRKADVTGEMHMTGENQRQRGMRTKLSKHAEINTVIHTATATNTNNVVLIIIKY